MDKKKGILWYLSQVFMLYGIIVLLISVFCKFFGEEAVAVSTIFSLGDKGIAVSTMLEFLLAIALSVFLRFIFMTDIIIKKLSLVIRRIAMLSGGLLVIIGFIFAFEWFPVKDGKAWGLFIIGFILSCGISTFVAALAEKQENRRLEEALKHFKEEN